MSIDGVGIWLYAVTAAESAGGVVDGLSGVAGEKIRLVAGDGLAAIVGTVPLREFGEEPLRRHLEDLDWLATKARAHDAVISAVARSAAVVPVTMATVYLDDERVRAVLAARHREFLAALDRVTGRDELGVKAYADPSTLESRDQPFQQKSGERRSGTAYLMKRKRELSSRERAYRVAAAEAERLHAALLKHAVDGKRKPASDPSLSGRDSWTVLNGTYLVAKSAEGDFRKAVAGLQETTAGIELEITGPWPPYSFAGDVMNE
jgi:hypothetical protein